MIKLIISGFRYDGDFTGINGPYVPQWALDKLNTGDIEFGSLDPNEPPCDLLIKVGTGIQVAEAGDIVALDDSYQLHVFKDKVIYTK